MKYKAALFDMNGVLINDEPLHEKSIQNTLSTIGLTVATDEYRKYFLGKVDEVGFGDFLNSKNRNEDIRLLVNFKQKQYATIASDNAVQTFSGVRRFIQDLSEKGVKLAVVTSSQLDEATSGLSSIGIFHLFNVIVSSADVTSSKPNPEGYLLAASKLKVTPSECFVIEDTPSGVAAGKAAGSFVLAVTNTVGQHDLKGADMIVAGLSAKLVGQL